jgi:hypothetical protein
MDETTFAQRGRQIATIFANLADDIMAWRDTYWDRGYSDPAMTNEDVAGAGVTASDVVGLITFADALETFLVANRAYVSRMRSDM